MRFTSKMSSSLAAVGRFLSKETNLEVTFNLNESFLPNFPILQKKYGSEVLND